jgi:DNA-binding IclR family transcriptional regulator
MGETLTTSSKIAEILELLSNGKWRMLEELQQKTKVDREQIQQIIEFLKEYDFVVLDETEKKIRLNKLAQKFLTQTATA